MDDQEMESTTTSAEVHHQHQQGSQTAAAAAAAAAHAQQHPNAKTLSPKSYTEWVRSAEKKLLQRASQQNNRPSSSTSSTSPTDLVRALVHALQSKRDALVLTPHEWRTWCALSLWSLSQSGPVPSAANLRQVLDLHHEATRNSAGSALDLAPFVTYVHLLLRLHYAFEDITDPPAPFWQRDDDDDDDDDDDGDAEWRIQGRDDVLQQWTGLQGGPRFLHLAHRSSPNTTLLVGYADDFHLTIPTRSQLRAAGPQVEAEWDQLLGQEAVRQAVREANTRAAGHVTGSHLVWDPLRDFELLHLERQRSSEKAETVKQVFMARLRVPHRTHEVTAQAFSSFVSRYLAASAYESTMSSLQKPYGTMKAVMTVIEPYEGQLRAAQDDADDSSKQWQAWKIYLKAITSGKNLDVDRISAAFERCLAYLGSPPSLQSTEVEAHPPVEEWEAEFTKARSKMHRDQRHALERAEREEHRQQWQRREDLWSDYAFFLLNAKAPASQLLDALERSVRSLPASGLLWATYLRHLARLHRSKAHIDETFSRALDGGECGRDDYYRHRDGSEAKNNVVELLVGRIDAERELAAIALATDQGLTVVDALAQLPRDPDRFMEIYALISYVLGLPADKPAAAFDRTLRLQRLASSWADAGGEGMCSLAEPVWEAVLGQQPTNGLVWLESALLQIKLGNVAKARSLFRQGASRGGLTDKARLLDEWRRFEVVYGSAQELIRVEERMRREREKQWEEWAQYAQMQQQQQQQYDAAAAAATTPATAATSTGGQGAMDVDDGGGGGAGAEGASSSSSSQGQKRKQDGAGADAEREDARPAMQTDGDAAPKRGRAGDNQLPRDRENSSILVAGLPLDATVAELQRLFQDCGQIREISGPRAVDALSSAGVVEFMDRSSIPAARTKDKKRIREHEVSVSLGWECTLYVTNFPETADDAAIRTLFANHGTIYDVRWPSKKFDASRRFCYVQFTAPGAAQSALALHQHTFGPDSTSLQVFLSDPSKRKQRSDANANERELYVTGLARSTSAAEVRALFEAQGAVVGLRVPTLPDGKPKGLAFVDFRTPLEAQRAVGVLNGYLLHGKALRVQLADGGGGGRSGGGRQASPSASSRASVGPGGASGTTPTLLLDAEFRSRAIKVQGLPRDAQEALIQQVFERATGGVVVGQGGASRVRRVEWAAAAGTSTSTSTSSAVVEFDSPATVGRLLLAAQAGQGLQYDGAHPLVLQALEGGGGGPRAAPAADADADADAQAKTTAAPPPATSPAAMIPRSAARGRGARGRARGGAGLGFGGARPQAQAQAQAGTTATTTAAGAGMDTSMDLDGSSAPASASVGDGATTAKKGQDDFRAMLARGRGRGSGGGGA